MNLSRSRLLVVVPALALLIPACGSSTATSPTATTTATSTATVTVTAEPNPATAAGSSNPAYSWSLSFVATIANTNASPITIRSITADLQQASGGIVITPNVGTDESFRFDVRAPGNRIDVNSSMAILFTFFYTLPNGGREALATLSFSVVTDAGAAGSITASVNIR